MKFVQRLVPLGSLVLLAACAAETDESIETGTAEAELSSRPVTAAECAAYQRQYPVTETRTLSTGDVVGLPLRACDMNISAIFGTIDLAFAKELFSGTGYVPLEVHRLGKPVTGLARLYFVDYVSMDLGPYREMIVLVDGAESTASLDAKHLTWANPLSTLLPAFDPESRTMSQQLVLNKEATKAIAYGRELLGTDKRAGAVDVGYAGDSFDISVADEHGAHVLRTTMRPDMSLFTLAGTVIKILGAAVGELTMPSDLAFQLNLLQLNQPFGASGETVGRNPSTGELVRARNEFVYLPSINEANARTLDFELDTSSALGRTLSNAHFTPAAFITAKHASGAWILHE